MMDYMQLQAYDVQGSRACAEPTTTSPRSAKKMSFVSRDWLRDRVRRSDGNVVVGRAILAIFNKQTAAEQSEQATTLKNGVGFTAFDARLGTITAKLFLRNGRLPERLFQVWLKEGSNGYPRICRYSKQLNAIAIEKYVQKIQA